MTVVFQIKLKNADSGILWGREMCVGRKGGKVHFVLLSFQPLKLKAIDVDEYFLQYALSIFPLLMA